MQRKRRDPPHRSRLRVRHVVGPAASVPLPVDPPSLVAKTALIPPPMGGSPRRFTSPLWGMCRPVTSTMVRFDVGGRSPRYSPRRRPRTQGPSSFWTGRGARLLAHASLGTLYRRSGPRHPLAKADRLGLVLLPVRALDPPCSLLCSGSCWHPREPSSAATCDEKAPEIAQIQLSSGKHPLVATQDRDRCAAPLEAVHLQLATADHHVGVDRRVVHAVGAARDQVGEAGAVGDVRGGVLVEERVQERD